MPLPARRADGNGQVTVELITETPAPDAALTEVSDVPDVLGRYERRYRSRAVYRTTVQVPADLARWRNAAAYHQALHDYARRTS